MHISSHTLTVQVEIQHVLTNLVDIRGMFTSSFNLPLLSYFNFSITLPIHFPSQSRCLGLCSSFNCPLPGTKFWLSNREFQLTGLEHRFPTFSHYLCVVCYSLTDFSSFNAASSSIKCFPITDPRSHFTIIEDFNVRSCQWVVHSADNSVMRGEEEQLASVENLSQLSDLSTNMVDRNGDCFCTLNLIRTSITTKNIPIPALLAHRTVGLLYHPSNSPDITLYPPQDIFWSYNSTDSNGFRTFLVSYFWNDCRFTPDISTLLILFFKSWTFLFHIFPNQTRPSGLITQLVVLYARNAQRFAAGAVSPFPSLNTALCKLGASVQ